MKSEKVLVDEYNKGNGIDMDIYSKINNGDYQVKIKHPAKPIKPFLASNSTPQTIRKYADDVEQYDKEMQEYREKANAFKKEEMELYNKFFEDIMNEVFGSKRKKFHNLTMNLYSIAYERGHGCGLSEIANILYQLVTVVDAVEQDLEKLNKKG